MKLSINYSIQKIELVAILISDISHESLLIIPITFSNKTNWKIVSIKIPFSSSTVGDSKRTL